MRKESRVTSPERLFDYQHLSVTGSGKEAFGEDEHLQRLRLIERPTLAFPSKKGHFFSMRLKTGFFN